MVDDKKRGDKPLKNWSVKLDVDELTEAKAKAQREGRSLALVMRKMLTDWLAGKYKPFEE